MEMNTNQINRMRNASGEFNSKDPITAFLYIIMRNGCPAGVVEEALMQMDGKDTKYTNGWLARYAEDVAIRLIQEAGDSEGATFTRKEKEDV